MEVVSFEDYLRLSFFAKSNYLSKFTFKPFHYDICNMLQSFFSGRSKNLAITIPPRFGKTTISHYFMAYALTYLQDANFIYTSYSAMLSNKAVMAVSDILQDAEVSKMFGSHSFDINRQDEIRNEHGGGIYGVSTGKAITGFGAGQKRDGFSGAIVIDDPIKVQDIRSEIFRSRTREYYYSTLKSRKNRSSIPIILIAQRLHTEDLAGWIQENEPDEWDFYEYQGVDDAGNSKWEEVISTNDLKLLKEQSPFTYYSQYMQTPIVDGGEVVKRAWFKTFTGEQEYVSRFTVADTAFKTKTASDYTVVMNIGITKDNALHIVDIFRGKWEFSKAQEVIKKAFYSNNSSTVYIEDRASGTPLIQVFKEERIPVREVQPRSLRSKANDKYTRLMEVIEHVTIGNVYLREDGLWNNDFLSECDCFRSDFSHAHDDQIDALVYALQIYKKGRRSEWLKSL